MKGNKSSYIIVRVTPEEKEQLQKASKKAGLKKFSVYIRKVLGLG